MAPNSTGASWKQTFGALAVFLSVLAILSGLAFTAIRGKADQKDVARLEQDVEKKATKDRVDGLEKQTKESLERIEKGLKEVLDYLRPWPVPPR